MKAINFLSKFALPATLLLLLLLGWDGYQRYQDREVLLETMEQTVATMENGAPDGPPPPETAEVQRQFITTQRQILARFRIDLERMSWFRSRAQALEVRIDALDKKFEAALGSGRE